jgi:hypothetical protein
VDPSASASAVNPAAAQSGPSEAPIMDEDMPLAELLSPDSSRALVSASQQTGEILQLLRRLEALNRCCCNFCACSTLVLHHVASHVKLCLEIVDA